MINQQVTESNILPPVSGASSGITSSILNPEKLSDLGAHVGYSKTRRHPKMQPFIYGVRNGREIIDLRRTIEKFEEAHAFVKRLGEDGKTFVLVGTKPAATLVIEQLGEKYNIPYISKRWLGGFLTNFTAMFGRIKLWKEFDEKKSKGELSFESKKEQARFEVHFKKMTRYFKGLRTLSRMPDALLIVDTEEEYVAAAEANQKKIPIVGIINTDCNPEKVKYPIPANENSTAVVEVIVEALVKGYTEGLAKKFTEAKSASAKLDSTPTPVSSS